MSTWDVFDYTNSVEKLIDDILKRMVFGLHAKPVVPSERIANDKTAKNIIGPDDTNNSKSEEGQCHAKR